MERSNIRPTPAHLVYVMKRVLFFILAFATSQLFGQSTPTLSQSVDFDRAAVFDEVSDSVKQHFYRKDFDEHQWTTTAKPFRDKCLAATTRDQFADAINELLKTLNASHTYYFSKLDPKRYQLLGVFNSMYSDRGDVFFQYDGIGIGTHLHSGNHVIISTFDGLPAQQSGLRYGDTIVSVDDQPFHPIMSFVGKQKCKIELRRGNETMTVDCPIKKFDGRSMFEDAMKASVTVFRRNGKSIGYIHIWSYAGLKYQDILRSQILWGRLKDCDSLVIDLRDGWGGADINYLNVFRKPIALIESSSRLNEPQSYSGVWEKPVTLLVNRRSTSGKELFAYGFKKLNLGKIVGERTAGAVVAGRSILLSNDDVLYLAVRDVRVDGQRLEHRGVEPHFKVDRPFNLAADEDPQLEKAIQLMSKK